MDIHVRNLVFTFDIIAKRICLSQNVDNIFLSFGIMDSIVERRGLMLWLFVGPTGAYLLDSFCSGIQFYLLLSPYLCFISLLYLVLYVLGDDALIS